jgi:putative secretion ATPase (PEP-CTERM system associated)
MYEQYYNFKDKPFRLSPDPRIFFNSQSHKRAMSYLLYGIKQGEGFIVITGDVGTGKSTLVTALSSLLKDQNIVSANVVTTQLEADDLMRITAAAFGLPYKSESKAVLLKELEFFFNDCARQGKRVLLLVDEAQNLPPSSVEELRMLSNFQKNGRALLQSFLLGQKQFRNIMRSPEFEQLRQRVIAAYHLRALTVEETKGYIEFRLRFVGWNTDPIITEDVFSEIHRLTEGIPRRVNVLCERLLLFGCLEELHVLNMEVVNAVIDDLKQEDLGFSTDEDSKEPMVPYAARGSDMKTDLVNGEKRIAALESSLASLGDELSFLRKYISNSKK